MYHRFYEDNWAAIIPLANEEHGFEQFSGAIKKTLNDLQSGKIYLIIDKASKDRTLDLARALSGEDSRFVTVWAPENRNVVDAYIRGLREAYECGHEIIIEMDGGLSHDPRAIPMFLRVLNEGNECAFGSRFTNGGSMADSSAFRKLLSKTGTVLANLLLGTKMFDMTSGFQAFHREVLGEVLAYPIRSRAHFYQTELRYLLRKKRFAEVPIHYRAASKSVSRFAITNALATLLYYFGRRVMFRADAL